MLQTNRAFRLALLGLLVLMAILTAVYSIAPLDRVRAGSEVPGRYQISSWASHSGGTTMFYGYYVLETATGKIVDSAVVMRSSTEENMEHGVGMKPSGE